MIISELNNGLWNYRFSLVLNVFYLIYLILFCCGTIKIAVGITLSTATDD